MHAIPLIVMVLVVMVGLRVLLGRYEHLRVLHRRPIPVRVDDPNRRRPRP